MYGMRKIVLIGICCLVWGSAKAQDEPKFRITHSSAYTHSSCGAASGVTFEKGYLRVPKSNAWVEVMLFLQRKDGSFQKHHFEHQGTGVIQLNLSDCRYTGNYYAFVCYANDENCKFPTEQQVIEKHHQTVHNKPPEFKMTRMIPNPKCGEEGIIFETGWVYSPTGGKVEITLFLEKKDGSWRKQHFTHQGTGTVRLDIDDCNLTGKYKTIITYSNTN
jgi:hypothetical protein